MCLFLILIVFGPRVGMFFFWLFQPLRFNLAFESFIWPLIGIVFVPWTTLMYVLVAPGGVIGWEWLWIGLALLIDVSSYGGSAYGGRNKF